MHLYLQGLISAIYTLLQKAVQNSPDHSHLSEDVSTLAAAAAVILDRLNTNQYDAAGKSRVPR